MISELPGSTPAFQAGDTGSNPVGDIGVCSAVGGFRDRPGSPDTIKSRGVSLRGHRGDLGPCGVELARFWDKVDKGGECWPWLGATNPNGYGSIWAPALGKTVRAHRWSYEFHVGPIPDGMTIDHLCRNRGCVNPAHLEAVPFTENNRRGNSPSAINARRTHCVHGHELAGQNLSVRDNGSRRCRACERRAA